MERRVFAALLAALAVASGCAGRPAKKDKAAQAQAGAAEAADTGQEEASLRGKDFRASPELAPAYFDYDRAELGKEARETLRRNVDWLKAHPRAEIQIAGHCDERGTIEYNIALGQARATAVRDYYRLSGIPMKRMATISYGEERPVCPESTEGCWQRNRRAETLARIPK